MEYRCSYNYIFFLQSSAKKKLSWPMKVITVTLHVTNLHTYPRGLVMSGMSLFFRVSNRGVVASLGSRQCYLRRFEFQAAATQSLCLQLVRTVLNERMANRLAIIVEKPGARQLWAIKPSFSSARQMTSSPRFQSQLGMLSRYAWHRALTSGWRHRHQSRSMWRWTYKVVARLKVGFARLCHEQAAALTKLVWWNCKRVIDAMSVGDTVGKR